MSSSWKLEMNSEPPRFALIIGDVHLPYFTAQEAREIVHCLEGAGFTNTVVAVHVDREWLRFMPGSDGITISAHKDTEHGYIGDAYFTETFEQSVAWKIAEAIELRLPKKAA